MSKIINTPQLDIWKGDFGKTYTDRNLSTAEDIDQIYESIFGIKKSDLFGQFLPDQLLSSGSVLEVGCNIGNSLKNLQRVKPDLNFYGVEPMTYAVTQAHELNPKMNFSRGTTFALPFRKNSFDLVMTNGVLIHIHPSHLPFAMKEIYRCTRRYIFFHEYFSETVEEIKYHGHKELLWKMNYQECYQKCFPDLECLKVLYLSYTDRVSGRASTDQVCLLRKKPA